MSIHVCKELFTARGYTITNESVTELWGKTPSGSTVVLVLSEYKKINTAVARFYFSYISANDIDHFILVHSGTITSTVRDIFKNIVLKRFELYQSSHLLFNVLKHDLVPTHEKVSIPLKGTEHYPVLCKNDPVARFLDFRPGDIIRITRKDGSISFRRVS